MRWPTIAIHNNLYSLPTLPECAAAAISFHLNHRFVYVCPPPLLYVSREKVASDLMGSLGECIVINGVRRSAITKIAWYPGGLAHKLGFSRKDVRKRLELVEFHKMLQNYTDSGAITRQEEVRE